nr:MAG TPA: Protein regulator of cytokinesis 1 fold, microtubule binding domain.75A [Caudoviricetes sp.]
MRFISRLRAFYELHSTAVEMVENWQFNRN